MQTEQNEIIHFDRIKKAAIILRALNNPFRQKIFNLLLVTENLTVTELRIELRVEQSVISQHLAILRRAKIISFLKKGKSVYYFINKERSNEIQKFISSLLYEHDLPKAELKTFAGGGDT